MPRPPTQETRPPPTAMPTADAPLTPSKSQRKRDAHALQTLGGQLVEVQGTAEGAAFPREQLDRLLDLASVGNAQMFAAQKNALAEVLPPAALPALVTTPD